MQHDENDHRDRIAPLIIVKSLVLLLVICGGVFWLLSTDKEGEQPEATTVRPIPETTSEVLSEDEPQPAPAVENLGTSRPAENPFHHAREGDWEMLDTTPVLKTNKYTSSRAELERFLVREVPAGTVLRITTDHGRWKEVDIIQEDSTAIHGWVDSEKAPGRRAETPAEQ